MANKMLSLYMVCYFVFWGFGPPLPAQAQERKVYTIAVLNLDAKGVSQVEAEVLSDKLRSHITQVISSQKYRKTKDKDVYDVVERESMDKIFEQFDIQNTGCVSDSCAIEFGKMLQVDRIIIGTIGKIGETFSVSTRIIDIGSSRTIAIADRQHRGSIDDVISTVIVDVGTQLMYGKVKKSKMKWYLIAGAVLAGGAGAAMGGGGGGDGGGSTQLPSPPSRPSP